MKKLSILMALVLMLVAIVPVSATTSATTLPAPIVHFDFDDIDDFTYANGYNVTAANGVATLSTAATQVVKGGMRSTAVTAVNSCEDITVFAAVKLSDLTDTWVTLFSLGNNSETSTPIVRCMLGNLNNNLSIYTQLKTNGNKSAGFTPVKDQWIWVACSVDLYLDNEDKCKGDMSTYYSLDMGKTWIQAGDVVTGYVNETRLNEVDSLVLTRSLGDSATSENEKHDVAYDDVRIYGSALTFDQIKQIKVESSNVTNVQVQTRTSETANCFDVRFCAAVSADVMSYDKVGYDIVVRDSENNVLKTVNVPLTTVYTSVTALGETVTAAQLGGAAIAAFAITGIPNSEAPLTFEVTPYSVRGDRTYYEATSTYTIPAAA